MPPSVLLINVAQDTLKFSLFEISGSETPLLYGSVRSTQVGFVFRVRVADTRLSDMVVLSPFADVGLAALYVASWVSLNYKAATIRAFVHEQSGQVADPTLIELCRPSHITDDAAHTMPKSSLDLAAAALWQHYPEVRQFISTDPSPEMILGADRPGRRESDIARHLSTHFFETVRACA